MSIREDFAMWRFNRQAVRRYWHMTPWRSCNTLSRGLCLRCWWRDVTGQNRRAKAAHIAHIREVSRLIPRQVYRKDEAGRFRYSHTLPPLADSDAVAASLSDEQGPSAYLGQPDLNEPQRGAER